MDGAVVGCVPRAEGGVAAASSLRETPESSPPPGVALAVAADANLLAGKEVDPGPAGPALPGSDGVVAVVVVMPLWPVPPNDVRGEEPRESCDKRFFVSSSARAEAFVPPLLPPLLPPLVMVEGCVRAAKEGEEVEVDWGVAATLLLPS